jgi:hypothetical protein
LVVNEETANHLAVDGVYVVGVYNFAVVVEETERISHITRHR